MLTTLQSQEHTSGVGSPKQTAYLHFLPSIADVVDSDIEQVHRQASVAVRLLRWQTPPREEEESHVHQLANNERETETGTRHHLPLLIVCLERSQHHIVRGDDFPLDRLNCQTFFKSCSSSLPKMRIKQTLVLGRREKALAQVSLQGLIR